MSIDMKEINIGIIGAGWAGREHARVLSGIKNQRTSALPINISAIADINKNTAVQVAEEFNIPKVYESADGILDDDSIDVVFICVPPKFHSELVKRAAQRGKAIFYETPFGRSLKEMLDAKEAVEKHGIKSQAGFVLRYNKEYGNLKNKILETLGKQPALNILRSISMRDHEIFPLAEITGYTDWRKNPELSAGGVLKERGMHNLDILEWLLKDACGGIERVSAISKENYGYNGIEDYFQIRAEFESGACLDIVQEWHMNKERKSGRRIEFIFDSAILEFNDEFLGLNGAQLSSIGVQEENMYAVQDYWFIKNLIDGSKISPDINDAVRAYKIADACVKSASKDGEWVLI